MPSLSKRKNREGGWNDRTSGARGVTLCSVQSPVGKPSAELSQPGGGGCGYSAAKQTYLVAAVITSEWLAFTFGRIFY
jgi:hypothetical protein